MALSLDIQIVAGTEAKIPRPPRPTDNGDTDPKDYIPKAMSKADRDALRAAGKEWAGTLGGFVARRHPTKGPAAQNVSHFLDGGGNDKQFGSGSVDDLMTSLDKTGKAVAKSLPQTFVEKVYKDIHGTSATVRRYLARNTGAGPNIGTNWFGVTAEAGSSWFYAVGAFKMACAGYAVRTDFHTTIFYRIFIYDRYNWDVEDGVGKETAVPTFGLSTLLDDDKMDAISDLKLPNGQQSYFRTDSGGYDGKTESYVVNDALMGALVTSGDAHNFDIVGAGAVHWVRLTDPPRGSKNVPVRRQEGVVR